MLYLFIGLQIVLLFIMALHDWIHIPPLTDIRALEKHHSKTDRLITAIINTLFVLIPLVLTWLSLPGPIPCRRAVIITAFYTVLTIGTILAWWVPYLFGSSQKHKEGFAEYKDTHHFLPPRGDNVVPNTFHFILHLFVWACLGFSIYYAATACF